MKNIENKPPFDLKKFIEEFGLNFKTEPYDFEKYRIIYSAFGKELSVEQYEFIRQNGGYLRIKRGLNIKVTQLPHEEQD
jgi:hypothetical protein